MSQPFAEVFFAHSRLEVSQPVPREVRIVQGEYAHETAVLTYTYTAALRDACRKGRPVTIEWGRGGARGVFHGYVHHTDGQSDTTTTSRLLRVVVVGVTDPLNAPGFAQYRNVRVDAVISEIARAHQFSVLVERHPQIWSLLQQEGQSTWAFLLACAKRVGWTLYARNTDVRCHSRAIRPAGAPVFRSYGAGTQIPGSGVLHSFDTVLAETLNGANRKRERVAIGLGAQGEVYTTATTAQGNLSGPRAAATSLVEYRSSASTSISEASAMLAGEQELNRHYIRAKISVSGVPSVHAASAVRLLGIDIDHDGFWYVTRAEHVITSASYKLMLEVGKDSLGDPAGPAGSQPRRGIPGDTSTRKIVTDGAGRNIANVDQTAPVSAQAREWVTPIAVLPAAQHWRSSAGAERFLAPVGRPAPIPTSQRGGH